MAETEIREKSLDCYKEFRKQLILWNDIQSVGLKDLNDFSEKLSSSVIEEPDPDLSYLYGNVEKVGNDLLEAERIYSNLIITKEKFKKIIDRMHILLHRIQKISYEYPSYCTSSENLVSKRYTVEDYAQFIFVLVEMYSAEFDNKMLIFTDIDFSNSLDKRMALSINWAQQPFIDHDLVKLIDIKFNFQTIKINK